MDLSSITSTLNTAKTNQYSAAADELTSSLQGLSSESSEEELKGVLKDFESYFVEQIIKQVKDTFTSINDDEDSDSTMSQYKDMYMDIAIQQVADEIVEQSGENFTQQLYEQMKRNYNIE